MTGLPNEFFQVWSHSFEEDVEVPFIGPVSETVCGTANTTRTTVPEYVAITACPKKVAPTVFGTWPIARYFPPE